MIGHIGNFYDCRAAKLFLAAEMISLIEKRRATFRKMGIGPGKRVMLPAHSSADFFSSMLALWSLEASAVPVDPKMTGAESEALRVKAAPSFVLPENIVDAAGSEAITSWPKPGRAESLILFTTGTLSTPRGVILSAQAVANKISALGAKLPLQDMGKTLCVLPVSFGHGLIGNSFAPWLNGCELTSSPPLDVKSAQDFPQLLRDRKISFFSSVPGMWALLSRMTEPAADTAVKRIFCASAPLGDNTFRAIQNLFPGVPFHNVYGLTEMGSWVSMSAPLKDAAAGRIGFPLDGEMKLHEGEIALRGPSRMNGYLGESALNEDEWLQTSDVAEFSAEEGYVIKGRSGHVVNKGGVKIQLEEIESLLSGRPGVREALCFRVGDRDVGENFEVAVVLVEDSEKSRDGLQAWLVQTVSAQRRPARWHFLKTLPVNARGKPDRHELRRILGR